MDRQFAIRLLVRDGIAAKHVSSAFSCSERASLTAVLLSIRLWVLVNATCTALLLKVLTAEAMAGALRPLPRFFRAPPVHAPVRVSSAAFGNCYQQQAQSCGSGGSGAASRRCYRVGRTPRHRALNGRAHAPQKPAREARSSATVSHIAQVPGTQPGDTLLTHPYKRPQAAAHAQLFAWPGATGDEPANSCAEASGKPAWWMQPRPAHVTGEHARVAPVNKAPTPRPAWWLQPRLGAFVVAKRPSWWLEQRPSNVFGLAARWKKTNPVINAKPSWWTQPRPLCTTYGRKPTLATAITAAGPCLRRRLVLGTIVGLPMGVPVDPIPVGSGAEAPLECPRPASGTGPPALDHTDVRPLSLRELVGQLTEYFERTGFHEDKAAKIADLDRILRLVTFAVCAPLLHGGLPACLCACDSRFDFTQGDWQQYAVCDRQHRYTRNLLATDEHYFSLSLICWHEGVDRCVGCDLCGWYPLAALTYILYLPVLFTVTQATGAGCKLPAEASWNDGLSPTPRPASWSKHRSASTNPEPRSSSTVRSPHVTAIVLREPIGNTACHRFTRIPPSRKPRRRCMHAAPVQPSFAACSGMAKR